jgi:hypothetical protein
MAEEKRRWRANAVRAPLGQRPGSAGVRCTSGYPIYVGGVSRRGSPAQRGGALRMRPRQRAVRSSDDIGLNRPLGRGAPVIVFEVVRLTVRRVSPSLGKRR